MLLGGSDRTPHLKWWKRIKTKGLVRRESLLEGHHRCSWSLVVSGSWLSPAVCRACALFSGWSLPMVTGRLRPARWLRGPRSTAGEKNFWAQARESLKPRPPALIWLTCSPRTTWCGWGSVTQWWLGTGATRSGPVAACGLCSHSAECGFTGVRLGSAPAVRRVYPCAV